MKFKLNNIKLTFIFTFLVFYSIFFLFNRSASAQELTLSISPPIAEILIKPGKSVLIAYTVSNFGDPVVVHSDVMPFRPRGNLGELTIDNDFSGPIRFNLENSNIQLKKPFALTQQQGQQLLLKIRIPEGTPEGDYYYTFFVETDSDSVSEGSPIAQATAQIGSHLLISVSNTGETERKGSIGNFNIKPHYSFNIFGKRYNIFESTDEIPVNLLLNNTGKNLIKPEGSIKLTGGFYENQEYHIIPENILAESSRLAHATPSASLLKKDASHSLVMKGFFIGKYILTANLTFGLGTDAISSSVTFYSFPFKFILALLLAIITAIVIIKKLRKDESPVKNQELNDDL